MEKKLYLVTTRDGKTEYTASLTDDEKSELIGKGAIIEDPATGVNNSSSIMSEASAEGMSKNDLLNVVKALDTSVKQALRKNDDGVSYTQQFFNRATNSIIIEVNFEHDKDNPGAPSKHRFEFKIGNKKVAVKTSDGSYVDVAQLVIQSGTININKDVATDVLYNLIKNSNEISGYAGKNQSKVGLETVGNLDEFKTAVQGFRQKKSKETIGELLKASRTFPGDDIQHKFLAAVNAYKSACSNCQDEENQVNSSNLDSENDCDQASLKLDMSLFIRLLEYAREDSKKDVDLHFLAENLQAVCIEKGCAGMDDYAFIISRSSQPDQNEDYEKDTTMDESRVLGEHESDEWSSGLESDDESGSDLFNSLEIAYDTVHQSCTLNNYPESNVPIVIVKATVSDYDVEHDSTYNGDRAPYEETFFTATDADLEVVGGYVGDTKEFSKEEAEQMLDKVDYRNIKRFALDNFEYVG